MLAKPHVKDHISELIHQRSERTGITADKVLQELAAIAFSDIRDYVEFSEEGLKAKPISHLTPEQARSIKIITGDPGKIGSTFSIRLHDKLTALELIGRHLSMFTYKVELPQFSGFRIGYTLAEPIETGRIQNTENEIPE